jgi:flagellar L-ring protein precursor FlgH
MNEDKKNTFSNPFFWGFLLLSALLGVSCMPCRTNNTCPIHRPAQSPMETSNAVQAEPVSHEGSLWREGSHWDNLFNNIKARNVGDVVTIQIVESSKATNKATTETERTSSLTAGIKKFFGAENDYVSTDPFFNPFGEVKGGMSSSFEGDGVTQRSGNLTAHITAKVTEVLPNGNLKIRGAREVRINHETQFIYLSGVVRPRDITSDNVVKSTYIADARIEYSGTGVINDRQRPGWLANILNVIWPF